MKAVVLSALRQLELIDAPNPRIEHPDDVLLKIASIGVCGSDIHYYETGRIGSQVVQYPFRVGHECSAVVLEVGSAVRQVRPGDRVAVEPAISCERCDQCRNGRPHTCRELRFLGCPGQLEGCLCEYLVMPERACFQIPDSMSFEQGALVEPLAIGYYCVKLAELRKGARIAVLGSGPIGFSVMVAAKAAGAEAVYMTDLISERIQIAAEQGAAWSGSPEDVDVVRAIGEREPLLLDAVFECAGKQSTVDESLALLKPGGSLMLVGIPREPRFSFAIDIARRKEIRLQNVRRQNECVQPTIDLLAADPGCADFMMTHRFPFERTAEAFELVANYRDGVLKAMIEFAA